MLWLFGYGSLLWNVDFLNDDSRRRKKIGYVKGYSRRFYQASIDHRGVPEKPGRVVTLIPSYEEDVVWGAAYGITCCSVNLGAVLKYLDEHVKDNYERSIVKFYPKDKPDKPIMVTMYIGKGKNGSFLGDASIEEMAKQISEASGPSGSNHDYLFQLASAMRALAPECDDTHLFDLEEAVKKIIHPPC